MIRARLFTALGVALVAVVAGCLGWAIAAGEIVTACGAAASVAWCGYVLAHCVAEHERAARRRRPERLEPLDLSQLVKVDAILHPHGRCRCCGEGRCDFCAWVRSVEAMSEAEEAVLSRARDWHAFPGAAESRALQEAAETLKRAEAEHVRTIEAGALEEGGDV